MYCDRKKRNNNIYGKQMREGKQRYYVCLMFDV
jgi:hypothetical protein